MQGMMMDRQTRGMMFLFLAILAALMLGEFYLIMELPMAEWGRFHKVVFKWYAKFGSFLRLLFAGVYVTMFILPDMYTPPRTKPPMLRWQKISAVVLFACSCLVLFFVFYIPFHYTYPCAVLLILVSGAGVGRMIQEMLEPKSGIKNEKRKIETEKSFNFETEDGWINVPEPERGIIITGGAGSGKTKLAENMIRQSIERLHLPGLIYDLKFEVSKHGESLTKVAYDSYARMLALGKKLPKLRVVNFTDLGRTYRVNPVAPRFMPTQEHCQEYAQVIVNNLMPDTITKPGDFWSLSAITILAATLRMLSKHYPKYCTIPHAVSLICQPQVANFINWLEQDKETGSMIASISFAMKVAAGPQTSGQMGTIQLALSRINTASKAWVLSADEVNLALNDPNDPTLLCLGNNRTLQDSTSPLVACIAAVALKMMNEANRLRSLALFDEADSIFFPRIDRIPATARSSGVVFVYIVQDPSQTKRSYGQLEAETIFSNINNKFFGKASGEASAREISNFFGKHDVLMPSYSGGRSFGTMKESRNEGVTYSYQQRNIIEPQQVRNLMKGEFVGNTVGMRELGAEPDFHSRLILPKHINDKELILMPPFASGYDVEVNFARIQKEADAILKGGIAMV